MLTSAAATAFVAGQAGNFVFHATGSPTPTITLSGSLPPGVTFKDEHDGTAVLSGTPDAGRTGLYSVVVTASNASATVSQTFSFTVGVAPGWLRPGPAQFVAGIGGSFTVESTGYPTPSLSASSGLAGGVSGPLPAGVTFVDDHDGTGQLVVSPSVPAGTLDVTVSASNGVGSPANMVVPIDVVPPAPAKFDALPPFDFVLYPSDGSCPVSLDASGAPTPSISETGPLPQGLSFSDDHNGTAVISGKAQSSTSLSLLTVTASNGVGADDTRELFLVVIPAAPGVLFC